MPKFLDISGNRYGRLVAISPHGKKSNGVENMGLNGKL